VRITALGHAGLKVESSSTTLLVDPWLSPFGAFQSSWFQYPENQHVLDASLLSPTAIAVSHEHLDHLDPWFLARVADTVPVLIPRYPSPATTRKVRAVRGGTIIELEPWRWFEVGPDTRVMFVTEDSPLNHDAAVVVVANGRVLLDLNDARLSPAQILQIRAAVGGDIDVLTIQGSSATWHPMRYELPLQRKLELTHQKRVAKLQYVERVVTAAAPTDVLPFAGPPCFLDDELISVNHEMDGGLFPDQFAVVDWLQRRGHPGISVLLPGDTFDAATRDRVRHPLWDGFESGDRWEYLRAYAARRTDAIQRTKHEYPEPTRSMWEPFRDYFEALLSLSPYFNHRIAMRVGFDLEGPGGGSWSVDFRDGRSGVYDELADCGYRYRFETRWLPAILEGRVPWEDFFLSLRFTASRQPDIYNDHLLGLLKFACRASLDAVESYEVAVPAPDRITVAAEGDRYSVQRYCPHAGADLGDTSQVLPGRVLRCLNHYYEFDLETGRCLNGDSPPLDSRRLSTVDGANLDDGDVRPAATPR